MKFKLHHPWWTHLPALVEVLMLICLSALIIHWKLPVKLELVEMDQYVTVSYSYYIMRYVGGAALLLLASFVYDEIWARGEVTRKLNGYAILDELWIGMILLHTMRPFYTAQLPEEVKHMISTIGYNAIGIGAALALLMELFRPIRPININLPQEDTHGVRDNIIDQLGCRNLWIYWESHGYDWKSYIALLFSSILYFGPIIASFYRGDILMGYIFPAILIVLVCAGIIRTWQRVIVSKDRIIVRSPILFSFSIPIAHIASVEIADSSTLSDLRMTWSGEFRSLTALSQTGGVLLRAREKYYYIGSKHPQRLATVIRTVKEYAERMREGRS